MSNPQIGFYSSLLTKATIPFSNQYSMLFDGADEWFYAARGSKLL